MELKITELVSAPTYLPYMCSGSIMELGPNAGRITWNESTSALSEDSALYQEIVSNAPEIKQHFAEYGFEDEEVASWADSDLVGLVVQDVSAILREDWNDEEIEGEGESGRIFKGDDGELYYYVGS